MKNAMRMFLAVMFVASMAVFTGCEKKSSTEQALDGLKKDAAKVEKAVEKDAKAAEKEAKKAINDATK